MSSNVELMLAMITVLVDGQPPQKQVATFNQLRKELDKSNRNMDLEWALLSVTLIDLITALHPDFISTQDVWAGIAKSIHQQADDELCQISSFADIESVGEMIAFNYINAIDDVWDDDL